MLDIDSVDDLEKSLVPDQKLKKNTNYFLKYMQCHLPSPPVTSRHQQSITENDLIHKYLCQDVLSVKMIPDFLIVVIPC